MEDKIKKLEEELNKITKEIHMAHEHIKKLTADGNVIYGKILAFKEMLENKEENKDE